MTEATDKVRPADPTVAAREALNALQKAKYEEFLKRRQEFLADVTRRHQALLDEFDIVETTRQETVFVFRQR